MPIPSWITFTIGREAVRRARRRGHDAGARRVVAVVVHAHDDVQGAAALDRARRRRPSATPCVEVRRERLRGAEPARALEHDVDAELAPRHVARRRRLATSAIGCRRSRARRRRPRSRAAQRPCTESNSSRCAQVAASPSSSLMWTNSRSPRSQPARSASRPMRPNPLIPIRTRSAHAGRTALTIAPCMPSATGCVNVTLTSSKPAPRSSVSYSPTESAPAMQPT